MFGEMRESLFLVLWVFFDRENSLFASHTDSFVHLSNLELYCVNYWKKCYNHTLVSQGFSTRILFHKFSEASSRSQHCHHWVDWHRPKDIYFLSFIFNMHLQMKKISIYIYIYQFFGAAQPAWSVLQSDCVMADQTQNVFNEGHICDQIVQRLIKLC